SAGMRARPAAALSGRGVPAGRPPGRGARRMAQPPDAALGAVPVSPATVPAGAGLRGLARRALRGAIRFDRRPRPEPMKNAVGLWPTALPAASGFARSCLRETDLLPLRVQVTGIRPRAACARSVPLA